MSRLKGKTALITGAGSGIGRAIAEKMAQKEIHLILVGRDMKKLEETKALCFAVETECYSVDLKDEAAVKELFSGDLQFDYLINNAGVTLNETLEATTLEEYNHVMETNVKGPFLMCKYALPILRNSTVPTIINIGSVVADHGYRDQSIYTASKHALRGMTKSFAKEVYEEGIRVHMINPGGVMTDMIRQARPDLTVDEEDVIHPYDIADIVYFILGHRCNAIIDEINVHRRKKEPFV